MNTVLLVLYIFLSTGGASLIKVGGQEGNDSLLKVPYFNFDISFISLVGVFGYGLSFLLFIVLLNKLDLSFLTPVATGLSYAILLVISVVVFNEGFNLWKAIGCILILAGVMLVVVNSSKTF